MEAATAPMAFFWRRVGKSAHVIADLSLDEGCPRHQLTSAVRTCVVAALGDRAGTAWIKPAGIGHKPRALRLVDIPDRLVGPAGIRHESRPRRSSSSPFVEAERGDAELPQKPQNGGWRKIFE
jgi:hypothetical protein